MSRNSAATPVNAPALPDHIRAMLKPDIYPHDTADIKLLQTHISWVILTGPFAYKLKKPHNFGFLDFSTLERRRHFCAMELDLNRRLAPDLYVDVLPVCKSSGAFILGESPDFKCTGNTIDYCVKMRQFEQSALFSEQIHQPDFDAACMDKLAKDIAAFHAAYPSPDMPDSVGSANLLHRHIRDNIKAGRSLPDPDLQSVLDRLEKQSSVDIERLTAVIEERRRAGFVRQCHGDLHLRNIALLDSQPTVFDCIEFNDDYRIIDVMNDIAFLCMDCDARARPDLGFRFLSRYLEHSGDYAGLKLFNLYAAYRAGVRGKVASLLSQEPGQDAESVRHQQDEAGRYFRLALGYTEQSAPYLFIIGGLSGSGKSHLALLGCGPERAVIIRSDATRKRLAASHAELPLYGETMSDLTYQSMFSAACEALAAGLSVILDATFLDPERRNEVRRLARRMGVASTFFWLDIPEQQIRRQIAARSARGGDISDANIAVLEAQLQRYQRPTDPDIIFLSHCQTWPTRDPKPQAH